jgi:5'-methylthioadenosine phosphorylase
MDIIGMTNLQEAKLAREAEICYATLALVTDYDCWHPDHDSVTIDMIVQNVTRNADTAQQVIRRAVAQLPVARACACATALSAAIITRPEAIPESTRSELAPIIGKYLS